MRSTLITAAFVVLSTACAKKTEKHNDLDLMRARARQAAMEELAKNFRRVHFEFDSSLITLGTRDALARNVEIMNRFPEVSVEIEGHCDERGSVEYNLALGQRRAEAIHRYMVTAGVDASRVKTISYGEEIPMSVAHDVNRRAEFRLTVAEHPYVEGTVANVDFSELTIAEH
jgi:peptidoglycan-associated lipoprotein